MTTAKARKLVADDNRGAIMVLGIFFACAMVAMMWYIIGIGDAVIWRDRSQEAADSMAFSSAAVHARGMNFIAFINIILALLTAIYLLAAIIYSILDVTLVVIGRSDDSFLGSWDDGCNFWNTDSAEARDDVKAIVELVAAIFGAPTEEDINNHDFCNLAQAIQPLHDALGPTTGHGSSQMLIKKYEDNVMAKFMPPMATLQTRIAQLAPYAGAITASLIGYQYQDAGAGRIGTALSPSMIPGTVLDGWAKSKTPKSKAWNYTDGDPRIGLPVGEKPMGELCKKVFTMIPNMVISKISFLGSFVGGILNKIIGGLGDQVKDWYCADGSDGPAPFNLIADNPITEIANFVWGLQMSNVRGESGNKYDWQYKGESFWGKDGLANKNVGGPKYMVEYAENGNDWMQVYSTVFSVNRAEQAERVTDIAGGGGTVGQSNATPLTSLLDDITNTSVYYAMAEFYLDCDKKWGDFDCNGDSSNDSNASFTMSWRSRLRRIHKPAWGQDLLNYVGKGIIGDRAKTLLQNKMFGPALDELDKWKSSLGKKTAYTTVYDVLKDGALGQAGSYLDTDTLMPDVIH